MDNRSESLPFREAAPMPSRFLAIYARIDGMFEPRHSQQAPTILADSRQMLEALRSRHLASAALLFAAGHQPLAFASGQLLHVVEPLALILGIRTCGVWARVLSHPEGPNALLEALNHAAE